MTVRQRDRHLLSPWESPFGAHRHFGLTTSLIVGALIESGAQMYGAAKASSAAKSAAKTQSDAAMHAADVQYQGRDQAIQAIQGAYQQQQQNLSPYQALGTRALGSLYQGMGYGAPPNPGGNSGQQASVPASDPRPPTPIPMGGGGQGSWGGGTTMGVMYGGQPGGTPRQQTQVAPGAPVRIRWQDGSVATIPSNLLDQYTALGAQAV